MKKILEAFINMLLSAIMSLVVTYIIDKIRDGAFNLFKKRRWCVVCGGSKRVTSTQLVDGELVSETRKCHVCNRKRNNHV